MPPEKGAEPFDTDLPTMPRDLLGNADLGIDIGGPDSEDDLTITFEDDAEAQNEDEASSEREIDDYANPRLHEEIQRERQARTESEGRWLREQEELERQIVNSEKGRVSAQLDSFKLALDGLDIRISSAIEGLKYARQEGDVSAETDFETQIAHLRQMRSQVEQNMSSLPDPNQIEQAWVQHAQNRRRQMQASKGDDVRALNPKAETWIKANPWFNDPSKATEKRSVMAVNNALVEEGYDPNSDEFFRELTRRVAKRHTSISVKDIGGQAAGNSQRPAQRGQSAPVTSARTAAPGAGGKSRRRVELDSSDRAMLRALGIDVSNEAAVKRYAREKLSRLQREQR